MISLDSSILNLPTKSDCLYCANNDYTVKQLAIFDSALGENNRPVQPCIVGTWL